jgi:DNA-binding response OmpR family regulator
MNTRRILLVEDEDIVAGFIEHTLTGDRFDVIRTADAETAWQKLESHGTDFGAILLDRQLPGMDGIALLRRVKESQKLRNIPVIIETSIDDTESIREGLAAGAYYYLTKPLQPRLLLAVVDAALAQHRQYVDSQTTMRNVANALRYLESGSFHYRTLTEAHELACGLAQAYPDPERAVMGLQELLINAVEHGNLGISYAEKAQLILDGQWADEIRRRLMKTEYHDRVVTVHLAKNAKNIILTIRDQGDGFEWQKYLEFDPERAFDPNGRGIAMAKMMSFEALEYQGNGNTVIAKISLPA